FSVNRVNMPFNGRVTVSNIFKVSVYRPVRNFPPRVGRQMFFPPPHFFRNYPPPLSRILFVSVIKFANLLPIDFPQFLKTSRGGMNRLSYKFFAMVIRLRCFSFRHFILSKLFLLILPLRLVVTSLLFPAPASTIDCRGTPSQKSRRPVLFFPP